MRTKELKTTPKESGDSKEAIVANLKKGFEEMELYKHGKIETTSAKDFLKDLDDPNNINFR
jgi:hypothetical protein